MTRTYICEHCKGEFQEAWSNEEALAEFDKKFPTHSHGEELVRICDDCYTVFMARWRALNQ